MPCSLDRHGDLTLVFGAGAGLAARANFSFPVDKVGKELGIPVMDFNFRV